MTRANESSEQEGLTLLLARLAQGVGKLVADHLALARIELGEDARTIASRLGTIALLTPFVLIGYALLCSALAVFLGRWLTLAGGLVVVGGANFVLGGIGLKLALANLRLPEMVDETVAQVGAQVVDLGSLTASSMSASSMTRHVSKP